MPLWLSQILRRSSDMLTERGGSKKWVEAEELDETHGNLGDFNVGVSDSTIQCVCVSNPKSDPFPLWIWQDPNEQFEAIEELLRQCLGCICSTGESIDASTKTESPI